MLRAKYVYLFEGEDVRRWYENTARGSRTKTPICVHRKAIYYQTTIHCSYDSKRREDSVHSDRSNPHCKYLLGTSHDVVCAVLVIRLQLGAEHRHNPSLLGRDGLQRRPHVGILDFQTYLTLHDQAMTSHRRYVALVRLVCM